MCQSRVRPNLRCSPYDSVQANAEVLFNAYRRLANVNHRVAPAILTKPVQITGSIQERHTSDYLSSRQLYNCS